MRETDERFLAIAKQCATLLVKYGLGPRSSVLDVGSAYGRLPIGLIHVNDFHGRYEGFDLMKRHVSWCESEIASRYANFNFRHIDLVNARYNPGGTVDPNKLRFPYRARSFEYCAVFSVFTHMYEPEIRRYAKEINRVLKKGGTCVATFFLFTDRRLPTVTSDGSAMPMTHVIDPVTRYFNENDPLHAISYARPHIEELWSEAGFDLVDVIWGSWAGDQPPPEDGSLEVYQDVMVLRKRKRR